jgi:hypothetical protein
MAQARTQTTNQEKLVKRGTIRMRRALVAIQRVGNLVKYEPTPEQVQEITAALEGAVKTAVENLKRPSKSKVTFTFSR